MDVVFPACFIITITSMIMLSATIFVHLPIVILFVYNLYNINYDDHNYYYCDDEVIEAVQTNEAHHDIVHYSKKFLKLNVLVL